MKKLNLILFLLMSSFVLLGQGSSADHGFVFPLGCRAVLQMDSTHKNGTYKYSVIYFEELPEVVDTYNNDALFFKDIPDNAIQIIFCISTHGKTRNEVEKNYRSALFVKSNHDKNLKYKADIQKMNSEEYQNTCVVPIFKQIKNVELWPYLIKSIALYDFEIIQQREVGKGITIKEAPHDK